MALMAGQSLGHYRIEGKIGEGGMGEVWRATDTKLGRGVALKLLPEAFAADPARLARFRREATVLASLNHPNIAAIHGLEDSGAQTALVLELVEGETLAARIARGAMSFDEARPVAMQIAAALAAAHEKGIIHRDLKPDNVKFSAAGQVKVLDFGLAKALEDPVPEGNLTQSPTLTTDATRAGVLMGTASYMSPEQAKGHAADRRSDIWAFGCVLHEMLTGRKLFSAGSISEIIAEILKTDPDWSELPDATPRSVRRLLRRCLQKDAARRLHDMSDARIELEEAGRDGEEDILADAAVAARPAAAVGMQAGSTAGSTAEALAGSAGAAGAGPAAALRISGGSGQAPSAARVARPWVWALAGVVAGALVAVVATTSLLGERNAGRAAALPAEPVRRSLLLLAPGRVPAIDGNVSISPDGLTVVQAGATGPGETRLYRRGLDSLEWQAIPGTENGRLPFFSPDSAKIGFWSGGEVKIISVDGGDARVLCRAHVGHGAAWTEDGWVYFTHDENRLSRIRATGGPVEPIPGPARYGPAPVPGRSGILVADVEASRGISKDQARIVHLAGDGTVTELLRGGYSPRTTAAGHLVFARSSGLFAVAFDAATLTVKGNPVRVVPEVWTDSIWAWTRFDVSRNGNLVYMPGADIAQTIPTWEDLEGNREPLDIPRGVYNTFALSPDQSRLAIQVSAGEDSIHIYDNRRKTFSRLTVTGSNTFPVWSRDGEEIYFGSSSDEESTIIMAMRASGAGSPRPVLSSSHAAITGAKNHWPYSVTPDGKTLVMGTWGHPTRGADIWKIATEGGDPEPVVVTEANEIIPMLSPDGRFLAYPSNKGGTYDIYVRPFPDADARVWQISAEGGFDARWSPRGDAIYYRADDYLMRVPYTTDPEFTPGTPERVMRLWTHDSSGNSFEISLDGQRFLGNMPAITEDGDHLVLVTGWDTELARVVSGGASP